MIFPLEPEIVDLKEKGDTLKIVYAQNVTPIYEDNYELRKNTRHIWRSRRNNPVGEYVGRVPTVVMADWIQKGFVHVNGCPCGCTAQMRRKMLFAMLNQYPNNKVTSKTL